jgi:hypothetical protein
VISRTALSHASRISFLRSIYPSTLTGIDLDVAYLQDFSFKCLPKQRKHQICPGQDGHLQLNPNLISLLHSSQAINPSVLLHPGTSVLVTPLVRYRTINEQITLGGPRV